MSETIGIPGLSGPGAQMARCSVAATWIAEYLDTPLLDRLLAEHEDFEVWEEALMLPLSSGERSALSWLACEVWPVRPLPEQAWDLVRAQVDDRLGAALDTVTGHLRVLRGEA